jgi:CRISPR-associated protein Cmr2
MTPYVYTAITFAPVQGFIEKSRKLRDLYGSSFILSYLANAICLSARRYFNQPDDVRWPNDPVISPALIAVARGTPNQILIRGETAFPERDAYHALHTAWKTLVLTCQTWLEANIPTQPNGIPWDYGAWKRPWRDWMNHTWEFFWATGDSNEAAREQLAQVKFQRAWTGINWVGESSTLSGLDSRAWPSLGYHAPHRRPKGVEEIEVSQFYTQLSEHPTLTAATISPREQLSIPELVKRLVTIDEIVVPQTGRETPFTFKGLNRWQDPPTEDDCTDPDEAQRADEARWTGWFQGDGDKAGEYLKHKSDDELHAFSHTLRQWGEQLKYHLPRSDKDRKSLDRDGRIIYAGGDDFMGVLYRNAPDPPLAPQDCLHWFYTFEPEIWRKHGEPITASVGFVWAAPNVPQREILQHCRQAERSAKDKGRDRIALRVLFNGGNFLEWVCPWWCLETILESYTDRNGVQGSTHHPNWTHFYHDVATLEARHAFRSWTTGTDDNQIALGLIDIYFGAKLRQLMTQHLWDTDGRTGILGNHREHCPDPAKALNNWIINLSKVGFHLCSSI